MPKLCQIIAIVNGKKTAAAKVVTEAYHGLQKGGLVDGISRTYVPLQADGGEQLPAESKRVQVSAMEMVNSARAAWTDLFDVVATQDTANCAAKADVVVDGKVVYAQAPVTNLLFLEKQMTDVHTFISKLPVLETAHDWKYDENKGCYTTAPISQVRTKKVQKPIVLYDATKEHPAQTQLITEDVNVGTWNTTHFSGAIPADKKQAMLQRVEKLQEAVKMAREAANSVDVKDVKVGQGIFDFIMG